MKLKKKSTVWELYGEQIREGFFICISFLAAISFAIGAVAWATELTDPRLKIFIIIAKVIMICAAGLVVYAIIREIINLNT